MEAMALSTKVLIFVNFIIYVAHLILNGLSSGNNKLFPATISNISSIYSLEMTPVGATFSIWGFIFTYQVAWIIYSITTVFRSGPSTNILSRKFYVCFILNILCVSAWLFLWTRALLIASLIVLAAGEILIIATILLAGRDLLIYLRNNAYTVNADVWCVRMLVQNGALFYGTWTCIATLLNLATVVSYEAGTSTLTASIISLSILGGIATAWFILESFVLTRYTEFTFSAYIVLIVGLSGILANSWKVYVVVGGISLGLLLLSILFLIARIVIIAARAKKSYGGIKA